MITAALPGASRLLPTATPATVGLAISRNAWRLAIWVARATCAGATGMDACALAAADEAEGQAMGCSAPPTMVGTFPLLSASALSTAPMGLATVLVVSPP